MEAVTARMLGLQMVARWECASASCLAMEMAGVWEVARGTPSVAKMARLSGLEAARKSAAPTELEKAPASAPRSAHWRAAKLGDPRARATAAGTAAV